DEHRDPPHVLELEQGRVAQVDVRAGHPVDLEHPTVGEITVLDELARARVDVVQPFDRAAGCTGLLLARRRCGAATSLPAHTTSLVPAPPSPRIRGGGPPCASWWSQRR